MYYIFIIFIIFILIIIFYYSNTTKKIVINESFINKSYSPYCQSDKYCRDYRDCNEGEGTCISGCCQETPNIDYRKGRNNGNGMNGNSMNGNTVNGNTVNGNSMNGNMVNGNTVNDNTVNGNSMNGNMVNGNTVNGNSMNGNMVNGNTVNGNAMNGNNNSADISGNSRGFTSIGGQYNRDGRINGHNANMTSDDRTSKSHKICNNRNDSTNCNNRNDSTNCNNRNCNSTNGNSTNCNTYSHDCEWLINKKYKLSCGKMSNNYDKIITLKDDNCYCPDKGRYIYKLKEFKKLFPDDKLMYKLNNDFINKMWKKYKYQ